MKIKVTKTHIKNGMRDSSCFCPIALAVKKIIKPPSARDVEVEYHLCRINNLYYRLPQTAREFITAFDNGHHVEPFEFELDL